MAAVRLCDAIQIPGSNHKRSFRMAGPDRPIPSPTRWASLTSSSSWPYDGAEAVNREVVVAAVSLPADAS
jgi:hypothetical protein